ncbi:MAG: TerB family tellurite resistance protein [Cyclobacteriaceae bacterium]
MLDPVKLEHFRNLVSLSAADIYLVPQNNKNRERQLEEMMDVALVDGDFARSEKELIKTVAVKLGFTRQEAEDIIRRYLLGKS